MPAEEIAREAELRAEPPHLVLEELAHRLDQLEAQLFGKTSDVVVRLDDRRRALDGDRFDHVGIERSLREVPRVGNRFRFLLEDFDEGSADDAALLFRVRDPGEKREKELRRVDLADRDPEMPEGLDDLVRLVGAHQAVIDQNRMNAVAQRLAQQDRGYGGVDSARERADDRAAPRLTADLIDLLLPEGSHRPIRHDPADPEEEVLEDCGPVLGVAHLRVKLDGVKGALS